jgi:hypothetical protein
VNELLSLMADVPLDKKLAAFYQHDGAPPYSGCQATAYLNQRYGNKWIERVGAMPWPSRSPDLTLLDFSFNEAL